MQILKSKRTYFIGSIFLAGVFALVVGVAAIVKAEKVNRWPVVKGVIIDSFVSSLDDLPANQPARFCVPDIKYMYNYKKSTFFNNDISYFPSKTLGLKDFYYAAPEHDVCEFVQKYPVNAKVDVYVNPLNPDASVLDPTLRLPVFLPLILGALLLYTACHLAFFHIHYFSEPK